MHTQLERLDQSFAVVSTDEAREILGGMAQDYEIIGGGKTFSGSDVNTTSGGTTTVDKTVDDEWS